MVGIDALPPASSAYEPVWEWAARRTEREANDDSQMQRLAKQPKYGPCRLMRPPHTEPAPSADLSVAAPGILGPCKQLHT
jgi:hypothetical protein